MDITIKAGDIPATSNAAPFAENAPQGSPLREALTLPCAPGFPQVLTREDDASVIVVRVAYGPETEAYGVSSGLYVLADGALVDEVTPVGTAAMLPDAWVLAVLEMRRCTRVTGRTPAQPAAPAPGELKAGDLVADADGTPYVVIRPDSHRTVELYPGDTLPRRIPGSMRGNWRDVACLVRRDAAAPLVRGDLKRGDLVTAAGLPYVVIRPDSGDMAELFPGNVLPDHIPDKSRGDWRYLANLTRRTV